MVDLNPSKVIRRVRQRLELSQESLARVLNATKGAIQHWERGRNNPDLARLLALRELCPPGPERKELDTLIRQTQSQVAPLSGGKDGVNSLLARYAAAFADQDSLKLMKKENTRLQRQVMRLESQLKRREEQLHILQDLVKDLEREKGELRARNEVQKAEPSAPPGDLPTSG
jgi:transcriptional regulator with XRE-family HTH domain